MNAMNHKIYIPVPVPSCDISESCTAETSQHSLFSTVTLELNLVLTLGLWMDCQYPDSLLGCSRYVFFFSGS